MTTKTQTVDVEPRKLLDSPHQMRVDYDGIDELAEDFKAHGVLQDLTVRAITARGKTQYEIVFGHRRKRAGVVARLAWLPCRVIEADDAKVIELMLVEHGHRQDIHPIHEAQGYRRLIDEHELTIEQVAERVRRSTKHVRKQLALCNLDKAVVKACLVGDITTTVATAIARIPAKPLQRNALSRLRGNAHVGAVPAKEALRLIRDEYMLRLVDAPFDRADEGLVRNAPACAACPKRTGNQRELFDDIKSKDLCADPPCYRRKIDAHWKAVKAAAKSGDLDVQIVPDEKAKQLFGVTGSLIATSTWVDLDANNYDTDETQPWRDCLGKDQPPVTLARDQSTGRIHELVKRADADKVMRRKSKAKADAAIAANDNNNGSPAREERAGAAQKKIDDAARRAKVERAAAIGALETIEESLLAEEGERAEAGNGGTLGPKASAALGVTIHKAIAQLWSDGHAALCKRRGIDTSDTTPEKALLAYAEGATLPALVALFAEAMVISDVHGSGSSTKRVQALCDVLDVDWAACVKRAKEANKAKPKPRTKAKAKAKAKTKSKRSANVTPRRARSGKGAAAARAKVAARSAASPAPA